MDTKGKDTKDEDEEGEDDGEGVSATLVSVCREWPKKYRKGEWSTRWIPFPAVRMPHSASCNYSLCLVCSSVCYMCNSTIHRSRHWGLDRRPITVPSQLVLG